MRTLIQNPCLLTVQSNTELSALNNLAGTMDMDEGLQILTMSTTVQKSYWPSGKAYQVIVYASVPAYKLSSHTYDICTLLVFKPSLVATDTFNTVIVTGHTATYSDVEYVSQCYTKSRGSIVNGPAYQDCANATITEDSDNYWKITVTITDTTSLGYFTGTSNWPDYRFQIVC